MFLGPHQLRIRFKRILKHKYARLARLDKPIGILLALFPALWAVTMAAGSWLQVVTFSSLMFFGAIAARSAGCIVNDLCDKNIDKKVARTKLRPLASGEVSKKEALILLAICGLTALAILAVMPIPSIVFGLIAIPMIAIYPLLKRITFYPQVFLGFVFNLGVFIGWFAVSPYFAYQAILLYTASVLWTIGFDTIYGHQDRIHDEKQGLKSLSIKLGDRTPDFAWNIYKIMMILIVICAVGSGMNFFFYIAAIVATYYLYWQTATLDINNPKDCADKFYSNAHIGALLWVGTLVGRISF
jgi:4-hydroxybenzoate polyprenyl transferase